MDGNRPASTREERHRKRAAAMLTERRRALITEMKAIDAYLAQEAADDEGATAILPGDAHTLPRSGNRPPKGMTS